MQTKLNLEGFILQQIRTHRANNAECRSFVLRHLSASSKIGTEVAHFDVEPHHKTDDGAELLATMIQQSAESDADAVGGVQKYAVLSYHGDSEKHTARFIIRAAAENDDDDEFSSEPANAKGGYAQTLRHNEIIMKAAMTGIAAAQQSLQRALARQTENNERLERERMETFQVYRTLLDAQAEKEMEARKLEMREKAINQSIDALKGILPIVAQKMLLPAKPESQPSKALVQASQESPTTATDNAQDKPSEAKTNEGANVKAVVGDFISSLTPEQMTTLYGQMSDEQREKMQRVMVTLTSEES